MTAQDAQLGQEIHSEHSLKGRTASATVVVKQGTDGATAHRILAGARAWLLLGQEFQGAADTDAAIQCARAGLTELGEDYADPRNTIDDTGLKILAADERIQKGFPADGASVLLRMLESRIRMYVRLHADHIIR